MAGIRKHRPTPRAKKPARKVAERKTGYGTPPAISYAGPEKSHVYERGQTVVPKKIREAMGLQEGATLIWDFENGIARVFAVPKDPIAAAYGILKGHGPTFEEFLADRNAERERERKLEEEQDLRWRTSSTRPRS